MYAGAVAPRGSLTEANVKRVTLRIYGQDFTFQASDNEAHRLIAAMRSADYARDNVRRLEDQLAAAKAEAFDPNSVSRIKVEHVEPEPA